MTQVSTAGGSQVTAPTANAAIAQLNAVPAGFYQLTVTVSLSGTILAADNNNFKLVFSNSVNFTGLIPCTGAPVTITGNVQHAGGVISVNCVAAGGPACMYAALIVITPIDYPG